MDQQLRECINPPKPSPDPDRGRPTDCISHCLIQDTHTHPHPHPRLILPRGPCASCPALNRKFCFQMQCFLSNRAIFIRQQAKLLPFKKTFAHTHPHPSVATSQAGDPASCQGKPWVNTTLGEKTPSGFTALVGQAQAGLRSQLTPWDEGLSPAACRPPTPAEHGSPSSPGEIFTHLFTNKGKLSQLHHFEGRG